MTDERDEQMADRVERGAAALRGVEVPAMPAGLVEGALAGTVRGGRNGSGEAARGVPEKLEIRGSFEKGWRMKMVRRTAVAAALAVAAGVAVVAGTWGVGGRVAYAEVLEQVKGAKMVKCHMEATLKSALEKVPPKELQAEMVMSEEGWMVTITPSVRAVTDATGREMMVFDSRREVVMVEAKNQPERKEKAPNLLVLFKTLPSSGEKSLGRKEVEGHKVKGFSVEKPGEHVEIWADEVTEKPVLVTVHVGGATKVAEGDFTYSQFDWNPERPELANFEAPEGYRVLKTTVDLSAPGEKDVVTMLSTVAELNGGELPEKVDMRTVMEIIRTQGGSMGGPEALMEKLSPISRGWKFIGNPGSGKTWEYAGEGVKWGEKGKGVMWYQAAGKEGWRVFDADGTVEERSEKPAGGKEVEFAGKGVGATGR